MLVCGTVYWGWIHMNYWRTGFFTKYMSTGWGICFGLRLARHLQDLFIPVCNIACHVVAHRVVHTIRQGASAFELDAGMPQGRLRRTARNSLCSSLLATLYMTATQGITWSWGTLTDPASSFHTIPLNVPFIFVQQWIGYGTQCLFLALLYMMTEFLVLGMSQVEAAVRERRQAQDVLTLYYSISSRYDEIRQHFEKCMVFDLLIASYVYTLVDVTIEASVQILNINDMIFGGDHPCLESGHGTPESIRSATNTLFDWSYVAVLVICFWRANRITKRIINIIPSMLYNNDQAANEIWLITHCLSTNPIELKVFGMRPGYPVALILATNVLARAYLQCH
jgi:hypothetical protein